MKIFLRILMTVVVALAVIGTVLFLTKQNENYLPNENQDVEVLTPKNNEDKDENLTSGENENNIDEFVSGDEEDVKELSGDNNEIDFENDESGELITSGDEVENTIPSDDEVNTSGEPEVIHWPNNTVSGESENIVNENQTSGESI